ncbi:S49 family peptidase [Pontibacter mangrovi]|uniref:S49 family peptidase n=1 Tax=Pontibacter mangrovi TaxID=2589816 RepID=A0A501WEH8_9BACT|nr:S49 family peptidase [Pontibacter mangrovi]TPE43966.1 S49 family peptidase [Pontibacter mangrovi]
MLQIITDTRAWALESRYFSQVEATVLRLVQEGSISTENFTSQKKEDLPLPTVQGVAADTVSAATPFAVFEAASGDLNYNSEQEVKVALIPVRGAMTKYGGMCSYGTKDIRSWLASAVNNPNIGAIVLVGDTPGGAVDGTEDLAADIKKARETKPVVGFIDGLVASAGYWVFSQADHIFINSETTSWVGSIGTLCVHVNQSEFLKRQGLEVTYITADKSVDKVKGNSMSALDEEALAMFKADLNTINETFLSTVKAGRGSKLADEKQWGTAKVFNGKDGKALGLVDAIGSLEDAIRKAAQLAQAKPSSSRKPKSNHNSEMKFESFKSNYPMLSAALTAMGIFSASTESVAVDEQFLANAEAAVAAAQAATATAEAAQKVAEDKLTTATASVDSLTTERDGLKEQVSTLETWKKEAEGKKSPKEDESNSQGAKAMSPYNAYAQRFKGKAE